MTRRIPVSAEPAVAPEDLPEPREGSVEPALGSPAKTGRLRRAPQQVRGSARVHAILDAAERVVAEAGPDGASMNAVAKAAGTAPGSLYHFFPDKDALLDAVAERQAERFSALHVEAIPLQAATWPLRRTLEHALTQFAAFYEANPTFEPIRRAIARRAGGVDRLLARDTSDNDVVAGTMERLLEPRMPERAAAERRRVAKAVVAMADGVFSALAEQPAAEHRALVAELLDALDAYLERAISRGRRVRGGARGSGRSAKPEH